MTLYPSPAITERSTAAWAQPQLLLAKFLQIHVEEKEMPGRCVGKVKSGYFLKDVILLEFYIYYI